MKILINESELCGSGFVLEALASFPSPEEGEDVRRRKVSEERDGRDAGMNKKEEKRGGQEKRPDRGSLHLSGSGLGRAVEQRRDVAGGTLIG